MWRLPGYGEFLEQSDPGLRERMADERRSGRLRGRGRDPQPDRRDQPDIPAHWGVTFAVDDADAIGREGRGAGRPGDRRAVRCSLGQDDRHHRSAGRNIHREQVRAGEQGPGNPDRLDGQRILGMILRRTADHSTGEAGAGAPACPGCECERCQFVPTDARCCNERRASERGSAIISRREARQTHAWFSCTSPFLTTDSSTYSASPSRHSYASHHRLRPFPSGGYLAPL